MQWLFISYIAEIAACWLLIRSTKQVDETQIVIVLSLLQRRRRYCYNVYCTQLTQLHTSKTNEFVGYYEALALICLDLSQSLNFVLTTMPLLRTRTKL